MEILIWVLVLKFLEIKPNSLNQNQVHFTQKRNKHKNMTLTRPFHATLWVVEAGLLAITMQQLNSYRIVFRIRIFTGKLVKY